MEGMEVQPLLTRTVCLSQGHLKQLWLTQKLYAQLGCSYNPHQPQILWCEVVLDLPAPRLLRIKGHASQAIPNTEAPSVRVSVKMGTYLVFYMPKMERDWASSHLILNGVQSVKGGKENGATFALHLIDTSDQQLGNSIDSKISLQGKTAEKPDDESPNTNHTHESNISNGQSGLSTKEPKVNSNDQNIKGKDKFVAKREIICEALSIGSSTEDFGSINEVTTLLEDEEIIPSDQESDDDSEDIHKVIRKRLVIEITSLLKEWQKLENHQNILVLLLKPEQKHQAWQFLSSWIMIKEKSCEQSGSCSTLTRKRGVLRTKAPSIAVENDKQKGGTTEVLNRR